MNYEYNQYGHQADMVHDPHGSAAYRNHDGSDMNQLLMQMRHSEPAGGSLDQHHLNHGHHPPGGEAYDPHHEPAGEQGVPELPPQQQPEKPDDSDWHVPSFRVDLCRSPESDETEDVDLKTWINRNPDKRDQFNSHDKDALLYFPRKINRHNVLPYLNGVCLDFGFKLVKQGMNMNKGKTITSITLVCERGIKYVSKCSEDKRRGSAKPATDAERCKFKITIQERKDDGRLYVRKNGGGFNFGHRGHPQPPMSAREEFHAMYEQTMRMVVTASDRDMVREGFLAMQRGLLSRKRKSPL